MRPLGNMVELPASARKLGSVQNPIHNTTAVAHNSEQDYPLVLAGEVAELLCRRGFTAEGARYWARKVVAHGNAEVANSLALVIYDCMKQAEENLANRHALDLAVQNYVEQHR